MNKWLFNSLIALTVGSTAALLTSCEISSSDNVDRSLGVDFTGFYTRGGAPIPSRNSGTPITSFDLRQTGDQLDAIDNVGNIWRGTIAEFPFNGTSAPFELKGLTTAGNQGHFSGTLTAGGANGTMTGTYIEDAFYATFTANATIPGINTNSAGGSLNITPNGTALPVGSSQPFNVTGGGGTYNWSVSDSSRGSLSSTTGSSVTLTRIASGTFTLSVSDGNGHSDSVTIN